MSRLVKTLYRSMLKFASHRKIVGNHFFIPILQEGLLGDTQQLRSSSNDWNTRSDSRLLRFQLWADTMGCEYNGGRGSSNVRKLDSEMETLLGKLLPKSLLEAPRFLPVRIPHMSFLAENDLLCGVRNAMGLKRAIKHCFKDDANSVVPAGKKIDIAFHSLKTLNLMRGDLERAYDEHVRNSSEELVRYRQFNVGDTIYHKKGLWRGVVRKWTVDEQRCKQRCTVVVGGSSSPEITHAAYGSDADIEPVETYESDDLELINDPLLRRLDRSCDHLGLHFDVASSSYVPSDFLEYRYPKDASSSSLAYAAAAGCREQQKLFLSGACRRIAEASSDIVQELSQICKKYGVDISASAPGAGSNDADRIISEVLMYEVSLIQRLERQLQRSYCGPRDAGLLAEMVSSLIASIETVLQARFQGSGITYFEGLLQSRSQKQLPPSCDRPPLSAEEEDMSLPHSLFKPGDAVVHRRHGFKCVVIGYDQRPVLSSSDAFEAYNASAGRMEQPHYSCIAAASGGDVNAATRIVYVPQEDLVLDRQPAAREPLGALERMYFHSIDSASGRHLAKQRLQFCFAGRATEGAEEQAFDAAERFLLEALSTLRRAVSASRSRHCAQSAPGTWPESEPELVECGGIDVCDLLLLLRLAEDGSDARGVEKMVSETFLNHSNTEIRKLMRLGAALAPRSRVRALEAFHRAREIDPCYAEAPNRIAHLLYLDSEFERALAMAKVAVALCPSHFSAQGLMGMCLAKLDRLPEARSAFRRCLELHPWSYDVSCKLFAIERTVSSTV